MNGLRLHRRIRHTFSALIFTGLIGCARTPELNDPALPPLHRAARDGDDAALKRLLARAASTSAPLPSGRTPLHLAVLQGRESAVRILLDAGADPSGGSAESESPFDLAVAGGDQDLMNELYNARAKVNLSTGREKTTSLHRAAACGSVTGIDFLVGNGHISDVDLKSGAGETPLHVAARYGQRDAAGALLDFGADPTIRDLHGRRPSRVAERAGHWVLAARLREHESEFLTPSRKAPAIAWMWSDLGPVTGERRPLSSWPLSPCQVITEKEGLVGDAVEALAEMSDGSIAIGTRHGLSILKEGVLENFTGPEYDSVSHDEIPGNSPLPHNVINGLLAARDGSLWISTWRGVIRIRNGRWQSLEMGVETRPEGDDLRLANDAMAIFAASDGRIFLGTRGAGITIWDPVSDKLKTIHLNRNQNHWVTGFAEGPDGRIWIGGIRMGVWEYDGTTIRRHTSGDSWLPDNDVRSLAMDRSGNLWMGTHKGLGVRFADGKSRVYTGRDVLPEEMVMSLACRRNGEIWARTYEGYAIYDGKRWSYPIPQSPDPKGQVFLSDLEAKNGEIWYGTWDGVIFNPPLQRTESNPIRAAREALRKRIEREFPKWPSDHFVGGAGRFLVWWHDGDRLRTYDGQQWCDRATDGEFGKIIFVGSDLKGEVWIGSTDAGLLLAAVDGTLKRIRIPGEKSSYVHSMVEGADGTLYASVGGRIYALLESGWTALGGSEGRKLTIYPSPMVEDGKGRIWAADYNRGLFLLDAHCVIALSKEGPLAGWNIRNLRKLESGIIRVAAERRTAKGAEKKEFDCDGETVRPAR